MKDVFEYLKRTPLVIMAIIIGLSILGYGYLNYRYKTDSLNQDLKLKKESAELEKISEVSKN